MERPFFHQPQPEAAPALDHFPLVWQVISVCPTRFPPELHDTVASAVTLPAVAVSPEAAGVTAATAMTPGFWLRGV